MTEEKTQNPILFITDEQWLKLVRLLTENVFQVNSKNLKKVEIMYTEDWHYPAAYFRLTTVPENEVDKDTDCEISGFAFGFNCEYDHDVYINPLSPNGYREKWLMENKINAFFTYHELGLKRLFSFLENELKLWTGKSSDYKLDITKDYWREIPIIINS